MGNVEPINLLAAGFYTVQEAARLIEVGSVRRITGWLRGYPGRNVEPLLTRDYAKIGDYEELSFLDLMEVRFVEHFREQGVKVRTLRRALENARQFLNEDKPLATDRLRFLLSEDRKNIFVEEILKPAAKEMSDMRLWSLLTKQYEIYELMQEKLARGVSFDPQTHLATRWVPRPGDFPDIFIDPKIAFGRPVIPSFVPTETIMKSWLAEGKDYNSVADWFDVSVLEIQKAVDFELALAKPRVALAA